MAGYKDIQPRWQVGQSGNPTGRPKGARNRATVMRELFYLTLKAVNLCTGGAEFLTVEELITLVLVKKAINGDTRAYVALMNSVYGKPTKTG